MIEFLSNMSILVGLILQQAAYIFIACFVGLVFYYLIKNSPDSACTHYCNEGRNCTCKEKQNGIS